MSGIRVISLDGRYSLPEKDIKDDLDSYFITALVFDGPLADSAGFQKTDADQEQCVDLKSVIQQALLP